MVTSGQSIMCKKTRHLLIAILFTIFCLSSSLYAEPRRLGLVIGISAYESPLLSLHTAQRDARAIGDALRAAKFDVTEVPDPVSGELRQAITDFVSKIQPGDVAVVYFAGHGIQVDNHNYLLPGDFKPDPAQLSSAVQADELLRMMAQRSPSLKVLILDACRNNPLKFGARAGLAEMQAASYGGGTYIALSAAPGQQAQDGVFAKYLAPEIDRPGQTLADIFITVRSKVEAETNGAQTPVSTDQEREKFYFIPLGLPDPDKALETLRRISDMQPSGEMGQTKALEALIASNRSLAGTQVLQGLSLRSATLNNGDFSGAGMVATDMSHSSLRAANMSGANLQFSNLSNTDLSGGDLSDSSMAFADFSGAQLSSLKGGSSRWFAANGAGAQFVNANLENASFLLSDLRGANFSGANLKNAIFVGCLLESATFANAKFSNTDLTDAILDSRSLSSTQIHNVCRTPYPVLGDIGPGFVGVNVLLIEEIPNSRFSGGIENSRFLDQRFFLKLNSADSLPLCKQRPNSQEASVAVFRLEDGLEYVKNYWGAGYPSKFLEASHHGAIFKRIVVSRFETLAREIEPIKMLHVPTAPTKTALPAIATPRTLPLNLDSILLLLIKKHPEFVDKLNWSKLAGERARQEINAVSQHREGTLEWGRLFPDPTYPEQITTELTAAYRDWTQQRARQLPNRITMFLQPKRVTVSEGQELALFGEQQYHNVSVTSIGLPAENVLNGTVDTRQAEIIGADPWRLYHFVMLLPKPAKSYLWKLSDEQEREVQKRWSSTSWWTPGGEVDLEVTGVRLEPKLSMLIFEVRPVQFRMIERDQVVFTMNAPTLDR